MREIKFRAWDGERMEYSDTPNYKTAGYWGVLLFDNPLGNKVKLMQYTGLKDKNGLQEVYEGDIIDVEGKIKGNIYEDKEIYKTGIDCIVKQLCTKDWADSEKEIITRGCRYAE